MPEPPRPRIAWRATWQPAALGPFDVMLSVYAMTVMALIRGADYGIGDDTTNTSLTVIEAAAPLWTWSVAFLAGGLILGAGAIRRWHGIVWTGHAILAILYTALAVGIALAVAQRPWLDGIRSATVLILPMCMHWVLALRTGPRPLEHGAATATVITDTHTSGE